mmetsp:Transcript_64930/g.141520  ORF Transcript_64930/g.141520 Transcript_64930/m.141520 type:complete len:554 (+) Transcript_64930:69-1730(+)
MQRAWLREFNALGLQLRPQAARLVTSFLHECEDPQSMVEALVEHTKAYFRTRHGSVDAVIDSEVITAVINCMHEAKGDSGVPDVIDTHSLGDGIQIYNVLQDVRPFDYNRATKEWAQSTQPAQLFPSPEVKSKMYADRYHLLWQRLLLEGELIPEADAQLAALLPGQRVLTPVESLVGNPGRKLTFGLLSRTHEEGIRRWTIEDLHKVYPAEMAVTASEHLVTDGSFVLAEGELVGDNFVIQHLDVPGAVPRSVTREKDEIPAQIFGGELTEEQVNTLAKAELENGGGMYVVLCEVHLDSARTLERLQDLFQGYESTEPPVGYVLMGSFCSSAFVPTAEGVREYREGFERLKFMMRNLPRHSQRGSRFVFIPGPNDPGASMLPRAPLADYITANMAKELPGVIMATNPCRLRHFSREMVFFRHDVLRLLRRNEAVPLRERCRDDAMGENDVNQLVTPSPQYVREEMVRLLLDQAHLVPLPLEESNILWAYDHTLRLYPLPHAVFVGGVSQAFESVYQECNFCSVGPFHRDASFYCYHPLESTMEPCEVPDRAG